MALGLLVLAMQFATWFEIVHCLESLSNQKHYQSNHPTHGRLLVVTQRRRMSAQPNGLGGKVEGWWTVRSPTRLRETCQQEFTARVCRYAPGSSKRRHQAVPSPDIRCVREPVHSGDVLLTQRVEQHAHPDVLLAQTAWSYAWRAESQRMPKQTVPPQQPVESSSVHLPSASGEHGRPVAANRASAASSPRVGTPASKPRKRWSRPTPKSDAG